MGESQPRDKGRVECGYVIRSPQIPFWLNSFIVSRETRPQIGGHTVNVHVNKNENFLAVARRGLHGIWHSVLDQYLLGKLSATQFLFNTREMADGERTTTAIRGAIGKRFTWWSLKNSSTFSCRLKTTRPKAFFVTYSLRTAKTLQFRTRYGGRMNSKSRPATHLRFFNPTSIRFSIRARQRQDRTESTRVDNRAGDD